MFFKNQQKIAKTHHDSFVGFISYINGCFLIYEKIIAKLKRKRVDSTLKMTVTLYGLIIRRANEILNQLLSALDISDPSRSTNAAFAIGRLIESDDGKKILISDCGQYKIVNLIILFQIYIKKYFFLLF